MSGIIVHSTTGRFRALLLCCLIVFAAVLTGRLLTVSSTSTPVTTKQTDPKLATDFVKWWLPRALDYSPSTSMTSHDSMSRWMDEAVVSSFDRTFWLNTKGVNQQAVFVPAYYWSPVLVDNKTTAVAVSGSFISLADPALVSHSVKLVLNIRTDIYGLRVSSWQLAYDPDESSTIKFLSRASSAKAQPSLNKEALDYFQYATELEQTNHKVEAIAAYGESIHLNPRFALAYLNRGQVLFEQKRNQMAIKDYSKAIELDPTLWLAYFCRGLARSHCNNSSGSVADYDQAIKLYPNFSYAYHNRAGERAEQHNLKGALEDYSKSIELAPDTVGSYLDRADLLIAMGDYDAALSDSNEAVNLAPTDPDSYTTRGNAFFALKNLSKARENFDKASHLQADLPLQGTSK
jgi:tetratricopeptide (TPR) repeat protein